MIFILCSAQYFRPTKFFNNTCIMTVYCYNKDTMEINKDLPKKYTIDDLSELTGFSRRTIRFYIQENIIEPPAGRGRGGFYFDSHLSGLLKIRQLQEKGLNLESIRRTINRNEDAPGQLSGDGRLEAEITSRQVWARYELAEGIELNIRRDVEAKNIKKIDEIIKVLNLIIKEIEND
jgi:DNA-binding transcriptional MerR regulator